MVKHTRSKQAQAVPCQDGKASRETNRPRQYPAMPVNFSCHDGKASRETNRPRQYPVMPVEINDGTMLSNKLQQPSIGVLGRHFRIVDSN